MTESAHVVVGRVGKPFGVNGDVYVFADPDLADPISAGTVLHADNGSSMTVRSARDHNQRLVVGFDGVNDRQDAEAIRGLILSRPAGEVGLADGMIWVADLKGRQVVDGNGDLVGVVDTVVDGHAHDYLVVARPDGGSAMIPMVEQLVDWSADPIVVDPPQGLLDPDEAW